MAMPSITPYSHWQQRSIHGGFPQPSLSQTVTAQTPAPATAGGVEQLKHQKLGQEAAQQQPQLPSLDVNGDGSINDLDKNPIATDPNNQESSPIQGNNANITDPLAQDGGVGQMPNRPPAPSQNKPPIGVTAKTATLRRRLEDLCAQGLEGQVAYDDVVKLAHEYGVGTEIEEVRSRLESGEDFPSVYQSVMGLDKEGSPLEKSAAIEKTAAPIAALIPLVLAALGAGGTAAYRKATGTSQGLAKDLWQGGWKWSPMGLLPTNLVNQDLGDATTGWLPSMWGARGEFGSQYDMTPEQRAAYAKMSPEDQARFASSWGLKSEAWNDPTDPALRGYPASPSLQAGGVGSSTATLLGMLLNRRNNSGFGVTPFGNYRDATLYQMGLERGRRKARRRRRRRRRDRLASPVTPAAAEAPAPAAPPAASPAPAAPPVAPPSPGTAAQLPAPPPGTAPPGTAAQLPFPTHNTPKPAATPYAPYTPRRSNIPEGPWGDRYKEQANYYHEHGYDNPLPPENVWDPIEKGGEYLSLVEKSASDAGIVLDPLAIGFVARCCERGMNADQIVLAAEKTAESFPGLSEKLAMDKEAIGIVTRGIQAIPKALSIGRKATEIGGRNVGSLDKIKNFLGGFGKTIQREVAKGAPKAKAVVNPSLKAQQQLMLPGFTDDVVRGPWSKAPLLSTKDVAGKVIEPGKLKRLWDAPWTQPFRGAATGGLLGMSVDEIGDLTGLYDTGGMGARIGTLGGFGLRSPWAARAAAKAPAGSATAKALGVGKNMSTMGGWHRYGKAVGYPTEAAFWAPLPLSISTGVGEAKAMERGDQMAQQLGFDSYQDLVTSPLGQGVSGYNKSGILGAISGVWGSLSPQQKTTLLAALGLGGAGLVSALSGRTGLGLGLGAAGLGLGAYGMGAFGNAPGSLESVLSGANLSPEQASQLQDVFNNEEFAQQFYGLPRGQQSEVMQNILKQLQTA